MYERIFSPNRSLQRRAFFNGLREPVFYDRESSLARFNLLGEDLKWSQGKEGARLSLRRTISGSSSEAGDCLGDYSVTSQIVREGLKKLLEDVADETTAARRRGIVVIPSAIGGETNCLVKELQELLEEHPGLRAAFDDLTGCLVRTETLQNDDRCYAYSVEENANTLVFTAPNGGDAYDVIVVVGAYLLSGNSFEAVDKVLRVSGYAGRIYNYAPRRVMSPAMAWWLDWDEPGSEDEIYGSPGVRHDHSDPDLPIKPIDALVLDLSSMPASGVVLAGDLYDRYSFIEAIRDLGIPFAALTRKRTHGDSRSITEEYDIVSEGLPDFAFDAPEERWREDYEDPDGPDPIFDSFPEPLGFVIDKVYRRVGRPRGEKPHIVALCNTEDAMHCVTRYGTGFPWETEIALALWGMPSGLRTQALEDWYASYGFETPEEFIAWCRRQNGMEKKQRNEVRVSTKTELKKEFQESNLKSMAHLYNVMFEGREEPIFYGGFYPVHGQKDEAQWDLFRYVRGLKRETEYDEECYEEYKEQYEKDFFQLFEARLAADAIGIVVIPSSDKDKKNVLTEIVSSTDEVDLLVVGAYDLTESLKRVETKEKAHHGGSRSVEGNASTLAIAPDVLRYDLILVLDDVVTSGKSFQAVDKLLRDAGFVGQIINFAFARTVSSEAELRFAQDRMGQLPDPRPNARNDGRIDAAVLDLDQTLLDDPVLDVAYEADPYRKMPYELYHDCCKLADLRCSGIPYAIVSNGGRKRLRAVMTTWKVSEAVFGRRFERDEVGWQELPEGVFNAPRVEGQHPYLLSKPCPDGVEQAVRHLVPDAEQASTARIIGLGNTIEDMIAYRAAGIEPALALWGVPIWLRSHARERWGAAHVFESLGDFTDWCKKQDPSRPVDPLDDPDALF